MANGFVAVTKVEQTGLSRPVYAMMDPGSLVTGERECPGGDCLFAHMRDA